jgi:hypothetical protein
MLNSSIDVSGTEEARESPMTWNTRLNIALNAARGGEEFTYSVINYYCINMNVYC